MQREQNHRSNTDDSRRSVLSASNGAVTDERCPLTTTTTMVAAAAPLNQQKVGVHKKSFRVDAVLAAAGASASLIALQTVNDIYETPLVGSFLLSSAVKFFLNANPPPLTAFLKSSAFAVLAGGTLHFLRENMGVHANSVILFAMILFWKLYSELWTAATTLAIVITTREWDSIGTFPLDYLIRPYVAGHVFLYLAALVTAAVRRRVRVYLLRKDLIAVDLGVGKGEGDKTKKLRDLFDRIDTSGDGRLDHVELRVAFRAALGADVSIEDVHIMLKSADTNGDGTLDFQEFCAAVDKLRMLY